jgi:hypothetical protein
MAQVPTGRIWSLSRALPAPSVCRSTFEVDKAPPFSFLTFETFDLPRYFTYLRWSTVSKLGGMSVPLCGVTLWCPIWWHWGASLPVDPHTLVYDPVDSDDAAYHQACSRFRLHLIPETEQPFVAFPRRGLDLRTIPYCMLGLKISFLFRVIHHRTQEYFTEISWILLDSLVLRSQLSIPQQASHETLRHTAQVYHIAASHVGIRRQTDSDAVAVAVQ